MSTPSILRRLLVVSVLALALAVPASAGSIFLTGHDPDFHGLAGANALGAQHINQAAIGFIMDPAFNTFNTTGTAKFLFVESFMVPPSGHVNGVGGIIASGFAAGVDFDQHGAATLDAALDGLGTEYAGIVIASDFGGVLTQAELDILNARTADIIAFLNAGGGLYALGESNGGAHLTPGGGQYGYLPFVVSSTGLDAHEIGYTVTPFGASLGLTDADVNGNFSHNFFVDDLGLNVVDTDDDGRIISLAGRRQVSVPEPGTMLLLGAGLVALSWRKGRLRG